MKNVSVLILMSTYNGVNYIHEQLESIFSQKEVEVKLLIRDDGSQDNTVAIIDDFLLRYPKSITLIKGKNIGWRSSFFELISYAANLSQQYDYIAFSDQDDIWLPDKLHQAVKCLNTLPSGPQLYCSNLIYYKEGKQMGMVKKRMIDNTPKGALIRNYAAGCTILFNRPLLLLLAKKRPNAVMPHDYWAYLVATMCGNVYADKQAYILYRQHSMNQIGSQRSKSDIWMRRLKSLSTLFKSLGKEDIANDLLHIHGESMSEEAIMASRKLSQYRSSLLKRLGVLFDKKYTYNSFSNNIWLHLRILLGRL